MQIKFTGKEMDILLTSIIASNNKNLINDVKDVLYNRTSGITFDKTTSTITIEDDVSHEMLTVFAKLLSGDLSAVKSLSRYSSNPLINMIK